MSKNLAVAAPGRQGTAVLGQAGAAADSVFLFPIPVFKPFSPFANQRRMLILPGDILS